jgi:hypothetical protein
MGKQRSTDAAAQGVRPNEEFGKHRSLRFDCQKADDFIVADRDGDDPAGGYFDVDPPAKVRLGRHDRGADTGQAGAAVPDPGNGIVVCFICWPKFKLCIHNHTQSAEYENSMTARQYSSSLES